MAEYTHGEACTHSIPRQHAHILVVYQGSMLTYTSSIPRQHAHILVVYQGSMLTY